ncbi:MAG: hypothetical protein KAR79_03205 [Simkaniaceae bacterium]|nr:hypothetical protein [Simkaniaceae bacterium]
MSTITGLNDSPFVIIAPEIMQLILTEAQVDPNVALVCKRWREEMRYMLLKTFGFIIKVNQESLTNEQIQKAKTLFINAVKTHRQCYPTTTSKIHATLPLVSIERYSLIMEDVASSKTIKKEKKTTTFWKYLPSVSRSPFTSFASFYER